MYVIFPAEEIVFFTYGAAHTRLPVLRPRPTLDNLSGPAVLLPSSTTAARAPPPPSSSPTPSFIGSALSRPPLKAKLLKKLGKAEDERFGRTARSPGALDFEQPAPLPTPAFSRRNIYERDFDALFEVSNAPLFAENVRVATPTPEPERRSADVTSDVFPAFPTFLAPPRSESQAVPTAPLPVQRPFSAPPYDSFQEAPPSSRKEKKVSFFRKLSLGRQRTPEPKMASVGSESALRELAHPVYNEALKTHNNVAFKLVKTVSDFSTQLAQVYEQHSSELQLLVSSFRKKTAELRKERVNCPSSIFHTWETLLQEAEADSAGAAAAASALDRQVARPLLERTFHLKLHARKLFAHRDGCDTIVAKADDKLSKSRAEYRNACATYATSPSPAALAAYYDAHNVYVQQLTATNGMLEQYHAHTLPTILQELEDVYGDVCSMLANAVNEGCGIITTKSLEQHRRYESLGCQARAVCAAADLAHAARAITSAPGAPPPGTRPPRRAFLPPHEAHAENEHEMTNLENLPPILRNEIVMDRLGPQQLRISYETLKKDCVDLEAQIKQLQDSLDSLSRVQVRSLEGNLFNKVNEIQDEISLKKYDYRSAQLHLAAVRAQKELFGARAEGAAAERKLSAASTGSMKNKWLKAFRSLKPAPSASQPSNTQHDRRNGSGASRDPTRGLSDPDVHNFQEYTYKKITPCDVCSQVLRGHTRQGLRCRLCKMNVHADCMPSVGKCQTKSRLLRRQKSTSEIESRIPDVAFEEESVDDGWLPGQRISFRESVEFDVNYDEFTEEDGPEVDQIYQVLKQASEISRPGAGGVGGVGGAGADGGKQTCTVRVSGVDETAAAVLRRPPPPRAMPASLAVTPQPIASSSDVSRYPYDMGVRRRLFAGMKSFSVFGSRSRNNSPQHRSISLPESYDHACSPSLVMRSSASALMLRQPDSTSPFPAPHSPRRQKLNLRMKSLSLDSPECTDHRRRPQVARELPNSGHSSSSRIHSPSSPVHNRRLLVARPGPGRVNSVDLPDEHDRSLSSASASPCPSPVKQFCIQQKQQRLLPTNLYVVLYNFKSRQTDELDLKAGFKVTVIDTSDENWWKGKCMGKIGYFPSKYCTKLQAGEKPLQVTSNLQIPDGETSLKLLRDQIVIQVGDEVQGMVMIRSGDNRQGACPIKYLQEV